MQLVRWNPMRDMFTFRSRFNDIFDDFSQPAHRDEGERSIMNWKPNVDIYDTDDNIVIKAELPGIDKKDISVDVDGRFLTLKGERSSGNEVKKEHYHRRERVYGRFERVFTLPAEVDANDIKADYKDGVLTIDIPKPEEKKPKQITVH
ncbi:Hsp20/alpha crystallin family protein [Thermodesulfobacteriota bacterium]